jgi:hypothetical protein
LCVFYADKSNCQNDKRQTTGVAKLLHFGVNLFQGYAEGASEEKDEIPAFSIV